MILPAKMIVKLIPMLAITNALTNMYPEKAEQAVTAPIDLAKGIGTSVELHQQFQMVFAYYEVEGSLPAEAAYSALVKERFVGNWKDPRDDFWEQPYLYRIVSDGFELRSIGPDGIEGNEDDLVVGWHKE